MAKAAEDILKEYLVAIGFKVDDTQHKKFKGVLEDLDKKLMELATVATGAAIALGAAVVKVASNMEGMYFASQRTRTSVSNLGAFRFAAEQVGISADQAQGALEGMQQALRMNPGLVGMLRGLNINPNQSGLKLLMDVVDRASKMPFYQGAQIVQMFQIPPELLYQLEKNPAEFRKAFAQYGDIWKQAGINPDEAAEKSRKFMLELRVLQIRFEALGITIAERFMPTLEKLFGMMEHFIDFALRADKATGGWSSRLLGIVSAVFGVVGALKLLRGGLGFLGFEGAAGAATKTAAIGGATEVAEASLLASRTTWAGVFRAAGLGVTIGLLVKGIIDQFADEFYEQARKTQESIHGSNQELIEKEFKAGLFPAGSTLEQALAGKANIDTGSLTPAQRTALQQIVSGVQSSVQSQDLHIATMPKGNLNTWGKGGTDISAAFHNPGNLRSWGNTPLVERFRKGLSIGKFAQFGSDEEGLSAMAGQLLRDFHRGLNTVGMEISKYAPPGENNTQAYIDDVVKRMGLSGSGSVLNLEDPRTLQSLMTAMIHHEQGRDLYNAETIAKAVSARLAQESANGKTGASVSQHNETHISVTGSSDPKKTSDLIASHQANIDSSRQRDLQGVMQ